MMNDDKSENEKPEIIHNELKDIHLVLQEIWLKLPTDKQQKELLQTMINIGILITGIYLGAAKVIAPPFIKSDEGMSATMYFLLQWILIIIKIAGTI
jgi:hypothetical protein